MGEGLRLGGDEVGENVFAPRADHNLHDLHVQQSSFLRGTYKLMADGRCI